MSANRPRSSQRSSKVAKSGCCVICSLSVAGTFAAIVSSSTAGGWISPEISKSGSFDVQLVRRRQSGGEAALSPVRPKIDRNDLELAVFGILTWPHLDYLAQPEIEARENHFLPGLEALLGLIEDAASQLGAQLSLLTPATFGDHCFGQRLGGGGSLCIEQQGVQKPMSDGVREKSCQYSAVCVLRWITRGISSQHEQRLITNQHYSRNRYLRQIACDCVQRSTLLLIPILVCLGFFIVYGAGVFVDQRERLSANSAGTWTRTCPSPSMVSPKICPADLILEHDGNVRRSQACL